MFGEMPVLNLLFLLEGMDSDMEYIYKHYVALSDEEDYADETTMMQAVLVDAKHAEEHVLNFKGSIKGHRVLNQKV